MLWTKVDLIYKLDGKWRNCLSNFRFQYKSSQLALFQAELPPIQNSREVVVKLTAFGFKRDFFGSKNAFLLKKSAWLATSSQAVSHNSLCVVEGRAEHEWFSANILQFTHTDQGVLGSPPQNWLPEGNGDFQAHRLVHHLRPSSGVYPPRMVSGSTWLYGSKCD